MHIADEIFPERNQEQDTQYATQQGTDEYLHEGDCHFRIFGLKNIKSRQGKDSSGYDYSRTGSDRLDNYVFSQRIFSFGCS